MVLVHALSSDACVIYVYTLAVFDSLDASFHYEFMFADLRDEFDNEEEFEARLTAVDAWKRSLPGV